MTAAKRKFEPTWIEENAALIQLGLLVVGVIVAAAGIVSDYNLFPVFTALMITFWAVRVLALAVKLNRLEAKLKELKDHTNDRE